MSLLIKGATTFLALTDTPASYAAQAVKGARVNAGETALEFAALAEAYPKTVYTSDIIYNGAAPLAFADLDVLVGPCIAFLKIVRAAIATSPTYYFRKKGDAGSFNNSSLAKSTIYTNTGTTCYALVLTDAAGLIQWYSTLNEIVTVTRIAYWPNVPMPETVLSSGALPAAGWYSLNCGVKNALVILSFTNDTALAKTFFLREHGEASDDTGVTNTMVECDSITSAPVRVNYVAMLTDANGYIDWNSPGLAGSCNYIITLRAYIGGVEPQNMVLFTGSVPTLTTWQDLDSPLGKGFAILKGKKLAGAGNTVSFRQNGSADVTHGPSTPGYMMYGGANFINYTIMPLDQYGSCEWELNPASGTFTTSLTVVGMLR